MKQMKQRKPKARRQDARRQKDRRRQIKGQKTKTWQTLPRQRSLGPPLARLQQTPLRVHPSPQHSRPPRQNSHNKRLRANLQRKGKARKQASAGPNKRGKRKASRKARQTPSPARSKSKTSQTATREEEAEPKERGAPAAGGAIEARADEEEADHGPTWWGARAPAQVRDPPLPPPTAQQQQPKTTQTFETNTTHKQTRQNYTHEQH